MIDRFEIDKANEIDLVEFLVKHENFTFKEYSSSFRCNEHPSLAIKKDRLCFYWHSQGIGGYGALDWLTKVCKVDFLQAMNTLTGVDITPINKAIYNAKQVEDKILMLPDKADGNLIAYNYLTKTRAISNKIINRMIDELTIYQDDRDNVVFVGYDDNHVPKFACIRGTSYNNFRLDCKGSDKRYSFNIKSDSKNLYVFESPIDLLSHATLENIKRKDDNAYLKNNRLSLGGTSSKALEHFLKNNKIENICLCLDNDEVGIESSNKIITLLEKDYNIQSVPPKAKDYNEDLIRKIKV